MGGRWERRRGRARGEGKMGEKDAKRRGRSRTEDEVRGKGRE